MNVFNILESHYKLLAELEENGGELTPEIQEQMEVNDEAIESKVKSLYYLIKKTEGEMNIIKDEEERLYKTRKVKENIVKRLKEYSVEILKAFGTIGKSGNYQLNYDTLKVYSKEYKSLEINEEKLIEDSQKDFCLNIPENISEKERQELITEAERIGTNARRFVLYKAILPTLDYDTFDKFMNEVIELKEKLDIDISSESMLNKEQIKEEKPSEYVTEIVKTSAIFK